MINFMLTRAFLILSTALTITFILNQSISHASPFSKEELRLEGGYLIRPMQVSDLRPAYEFLLNQRQLVLDDVCWRYGSFPNFETFENFKEEFKYNLLFNCRLKSFICPCDPEDEHFIILKNDRFVGLVSFSAQEAVKLDGFKLPLKGLKDSLSSTNENKELLEIKPCIITDGYDHQQQA